MSGVSQKQYSVGALLSPKLIDFCLDFSEFKVSLVDFVLVAVIKHHDQGNLKAFHWT